MQQRLDDFPSKPEIGESEDRSKVVVVARYQEMDGKWFLCHAKSYQNAFRSEVNGFESLKDAIHFANQEGCVVDFHENDPLQAIPSDLGDGAFPRYAIDAVIEEAMQVRLRHWYQAPAVVVKSEYAPGKFSLGFRFEEAAVGQLLHNSDHTTSKVLAVVPELPIQKRESHFLPGMGM